jgi:hypothetical protein
MSEMIDDFKNTWLKVMRSPGDFFAQMPKEGGYTDPVKFAAINYLIAGISWMIIQFAFQYMMGSMNIAIISLAMGFVSFIGILIIGFIGLFIGGGILHIFFRILGGTGTYEGTVRLIAYASAAMALSGIPFVVIPAGLYMIFMAVIGGTKVHKISPERSVVAVVIPTVIVAVIVVVLVAAIALFLYSSGGMYGDSSVMSRYNCRIALNTDSKLENLTFYLPLPVFMNESKIGDEAIIQNTGNSQGWDISMIETEHGTMLKLTAIELEPELHQLIELEPPGFGQTEDIPTGEVHSFTRGSIEVYVSMEAEHVIDTRNATVNEPILSPKYNMTLSDYNAPYPPSGIPPKTWSYDSFIYADYTASSDANVEICVSMEGRNEWWVGGWAYNEYRDSLCTTFKGERHGWIPVNGELVEGEGRYD